MAQDPQQSNQIDGNASEVHLDPQAVQIVHGLVELVARVPSQVVEVVYVETSAEIFIRKVTVDHLLVFGGLLDCDL